MQNKKAFTLVELLLVLLILTLLSSLAVNSALNNFEQEYANHTIKTLKNIETAILGTPETTPSGYIVEMGAPPSKLENLWINPDPLGRVFGKKIATDNSGVELYCGWRGPYLNLPINQTQLLDAWGGSFELLDQDGNLTTEGTPVEMIRSLGSDHQATLPQETPTDLLLVLSASEQAVQQVPEVIFKRDLYRASIDVFIRYQTLENKRIDPDPLNGDIVIRYYSPDPKTGEVIFEDVVMTSPFDPLEDFKRSISATVGPRALLAIQIKNNEVITSEITYLTVRRINQVNQIELVLIQK